ncbi:TonB-dependent receptor [Sphingopyxis sp. LARHCG72]
MHFGRKLASASLLLCGAAIVAPASGQALIPDTDDAEIVVTAEKRSANLLDVPVPVSAISSDTLVRENLVTLREFASRTPGLSVTGYNATEISIRGISSPANSTPTVAITVDDAPFGTSSWAGNKITPDFDPSDLQQIEVLRGPQGTLYGASSLGGLIKYVTRTPDTRNFTARVEGNVGVVEGFLQEPGWVGALRGALNVPILDDMLAVRASGFKRWDATYSVPYYSVATGDLRGNRYRSPEVHGGRAAVYFKPFEALTINLAHSRQISDSVTSSALTTGTDPTLRMAAQRGRWKEESRVTQLRGDLDLGPATLTSVSGWTRMINNQDVDVGNSFGFLLGFYPGTPAGTQIRLVDDSNTTKFSQEVRLASNGEGKIDWLLGGFYTTERSQADVELFLQEPGGDKDQVLFLGSPSTYKEYAVFGSLTYHFSEKFDVQIGGRYSKNKQEYLRSQDVGAPVTPIFGASFIDPLARSDDDAVTWLVAPRYRLNDDVMIYARVASGYRPGGPNTPAAPLATFAPDTVVNYEAGLKGRFLDRRLTLDLSLFNIDWDDIQLGAQSASLFDFFINGGKARSRGIEATAQLDMGSGWDLNGNFTYTDSELRSDIPAPEPGGASIIGSKGDQLPSATRFTFNVGFDKSFDVGNGLEATIGANYSYVGKRAGDFRSTDASVARQARLNTPSFGELDVRAEVGNDRFRANLFVRNLTNEKGVRRLDDGQGLEANVSHYLIRPRTVGVNVSFNY